MKKLSDILKIKGGSYSFQAIRLVLKTTNFFDIKPALDNYIGEDVDMFSYDDVVLDFSQISDDELAIFQNQINHHWKKWKDTFRDYKLNLIACTGFKDFKNITQNLAENDPNNTETTPATTTYHRPIDDLILELRKHQLTYFKTNKIENHNAKNKCVNNEENNPENNSENNPENNENNNTNTQNNSEQSLLNEQEIIPSKYIVKDLRGGSEIIETGSVIIVGNVNSGAQVLSFSDVFVFGELRGKILAGGSDNVNAKIITTNFNPELIAIAGVFKTFENGIPEEFLNKSVCVSLEEDPENDISRLKIEVIQL